MNQLVGRPAAAAAAAAAIEEHENVAALQSRRAACKKKKLGSADEMSWTRSTRVRMYAEQMHGAI